MASYTIKADVLDGTLEVCTGVTLIVDLPEGKRRAKISSVENGDSLLEFLGGSITLTGKNPEKEKIFIMKSPLQKIRRIRIISYRAS